MKIGIRISRRSFSIKYIMSDLSVSFVFVNLLEVSCSMNGKSRNRGRRTYKQGYYKAQRAVQVAVAITSEIWRSSTTRRNTQEIEQIFEAISFHGAVHVQAHKEYIIHSSASFMHCFTISRPNPSEYFTILSLTFISLKKKTQEY